ncbi:acyl-CoA synthetase [Skermanella sp. TT6]|uniref:Acyl-CoA synthetase n=1 Tax=Skermanella cutis TaxID=2775420 RepID=A0ABX7BAZ0_9PROT|nr:acyl-CoA synthetase [Skermanella sp. TT6]QQP91541.1 acyl-CoA synthetase [Skermanella sp. TT6]
MLTRHDDYAELYRSFSWPVPERYNIGVDVCDRHSGDPARVALIVEEEDGTVRRHTFRDLFHQSNRLANVLAAHGAVRGDRLAVLLPQSPETAIAHIAGFKAGMVTIPLFALFGEEALEYRLSDSGARVLVTDAAGYAKVMPLRDRLPGLTLVLCIDGAPEGTLGFHEALARASDGFTPVDTGPDDPAVIIYTSGTTGSPKGALHGHRVLLGHLPGVELPHEFFPQTGDLFWTPADWAWIGGLFDVLMPSLHHGVPVLAHRFRKFDPQRAVDLMKRHGVRNVFLPPTAIKLMRQAGVTGEGLSLRTVASGGETLGGELLDWGRSVFGVTINEFYGQTECNVVVGNAAPLGFRTGSMGRAVPGHHVAVIDAEGNELPDGAVGSIAIRRPDPVMFLGYWNKPEATADKFVGDWLVTGDLGRRDEDGFFWYVGRDDDVITSAGYRIGPGEVEECLLGHPAVALAAVIGVPDPIRTERVKAYVVLRPGREASDDLAREIQEFVKTRLAAHEYPRDVAFVPELPMTVTGKVMRRVLRRQAAEEAAGRE